MHNGNSAQAASAEIFGTYNHCIMIMIKYTQCGSECYLCSTISGWDDGNSAQAVGSDAEIGPDEF